MLADKIVACAVLLALTASEAANSCTSEPSALGWKARPEPALKASELKQPWPELKVEQRVPQYLGNVKSAVFAPVAKKLFLEQLYVDRFVHDCISRGSLSGIAEWNETVAVLKEYEKESGEAIGVLMRSEDVSGGVMLPTFARSRLVEEMGVLSMTVIMLMKSDHIFEELDRLKLYDVQYEEKLPSLVWRGTMSGPCTQELGRCHLVRRWGNKQQDGMDVGWSTVTPRSGKGPRSKGWAKVKVAEGHTLGEMPLSKMLKYRYVVSAEGQGVDVSLKWLLLSKSTVFMPSPRLSSWFTEHELVPWVHYVPLADDYCDLEEKYKWCVKHSNRCEWIATQATAFMSQFVNKTVEMKARRNVIKNYANRVTISVDPTAEALAACNVKDLAKVRNVMLKRKGVRVDPAGLTTLHGASSSEPSARSPKPSKSKRKKKKGSSVGAVDTRSPEPSHPKSSSAVVVGSWVKPAPEAELHAVLEADLINKMRAAQTSAIVSNSSGSGNNTLLWLNLA